MVAWRILRATFVWLLCGVFFLGTLAPDLAWAQSVQGGQRPLVLAQLDEGGSAEPATQLELTYEETLDQLNRAFEVFDLLESQIDKRQFDVKAKAAALGHDRERIFAFVRDEVRYEPYYGVMRGAKGTLMGLAGNALDQSMLLAALMIEAGIETRFVMGTLEAADAEILVDQLFEPRAPRDEVDFSPDVVTKIASIAGSSIDEIYELMDFVLEDSDDLVETLWEEVEQDHAFITGVLDSAGKSLTGDHAIASRDEMVREAMAHAWVQYADGAGNWVDLDPAFRNPADGAARTITETYDKAFPNTLHHTLRFQVTLRTIDAPDRPDATTTKDHSLLDIELRIADLVGKSAQLVMMPDTTIEFDRPLEESVATINEFTPVLVVGDYDPEIGRSFSLRGYIYSFEQGSTFAMYERFSKAQEDGFTGALGALEAVGESVESGEALELPPPGETWIGGLWIDYTVASPRGPESEKSREAFHRDILERCCQSNAKQSPNLRFMRTSCREFPPLGQRSRAVLLEVVAAGEVTVEVEVIVE